MDEKNRKKEEEKRKEKMEEEEYERRLVIEREILEKKMHEELVKDGKRDPNAPYQNFEKKKQVRRDQFEPSSDNPNAKQTEIQPKNDWTRPPEVNVAVKENLFANESNQQNNFSGFPTNLENKSSGGLDLPINNRREDLFGR